jgi:hypothetical protein
MQTGRFERYLPLAGILFLVVFVIANAITGSTPDENTSAHKVVTYWADHQGAQTAAAFLGAFAVVLFVFFAGALRTALRSRETAESPLPAIAFGGALVAAAGGLTDCLLRLAAANAADHGANTSVYTLNQLNAFDWMPFVGGAIVMLIAAGLSGLRTLALPKVLSWSAIVFGVAFLTPAGVVGFFGFLLWMLATSIVLYRRGRPAAVSAVPAPSHV